MELSLANSIVLSLVLITFFTCAWKLLCLFWLKPKKLERCLRRQGLNGTPYSLLFQDLRDKMRMSKEAQSRPITPFSNDIAPRLLPFLHHSIMKYGKLCFTWFGPTPVLNIMDSDMLKEIFSRIDEFEKPHPKGIGDLLASGLIIIEGEKWAKHRKIINPAFHYEKLKYVVTASCSSCEEMIRGWKKKSLAAEVDVWPDLQHLTGDVICRAAFGVTYNHVKSIVPLQQEQIVLLNKIRQFAFIPGWSLLPTKLKKRMKEIDYKVKGLLEDIVTKRKKAMKEGGVVDDDLLGLMLKSNMKEIQESTHQKGMSIDDVIQECKAFNFAGQETTSVLLTWTLILLSKYENWQDRAREEVLRVFGNNKPNFDGLSQLNTVSMILNEVLRLYPPGFMMMRTVHKTTKLGDIQIPPGVVLLVPMILIHHDLDIWGDDAKEFNPKRFSMGVSKATKNKLCYFPFSWGPRTCIGQNFAFLEVKVALTLILQNFSMQLSPSYKHAPNPLLTPTPWYGVPLILTRIGSNS
ncbi:cytochrome P450 CYP72A219-like [Rhodamnia argentea]|uniref:Cytochrome P450 CYP72A219-like n=1 Tax=Rhodamnia argentea TaxID=178133 RepID=A0A8B8MT45_9MYRT|nr:cytochrome P450 CYP72A219-like [Rhodamnia argentea]